MRWRGNSLSISHTIQVTTGERLQPKCGGQPRRRSTEGIQMDAFAYMFVMIAPAAIAFVVGFHAGKRSVEAEWNKELDHWANEYEA